MHIFDAPDSDREEDLESEVLPEQDSIARINSTLNRGPDEDEEESSSPPASLWPGAANLVSTSEPETRVLGRWGRARSRLRALEMQLDELLDKLPKGDDDSMQASANDLMAEAGAPRERPRYTRPAIPDLSSSAPLGATKESEPVRRIRRAQVPPGEPTRPAISVRRAPKLFSLDKTMEDDLNKRADRSS